MSLSGAAGPITGPITGRAAGRVAGAGAAAAAGGVARVAVATGLFVRVCGINGRFCCFVVVFFGAGSIANSPLLP